MMHAYVYGAWYPVDIQQMTTILAKHVVSSLSGKTGHIHVQGFTGEE